MKRSIQLSVIISIILASCGSREVEKSRLLEFWKNGNYTSATGYAVKYTAYKNSVRKSFIWNIYGNGADTISMWVSDTTFKKNTYLYPAFSARYKTSDSKTYNATAGQFSLQGLAEFDIVGDFKFTFKNVVNPNDSIMITEGYFRIYLVYQDSILTK
ncbi:MAG: hypothetical protein ABSA76_07195 [Bacteroidales bacterium]